MFVLRQFPAKDFALSLSQPDMRRAVLALDGPMFDERGPEYLMLDRRTGVNVPSRHPDAGITISVRNGVAGALLGASPIAGADVAVQLYPALVASGRNETSPYRDSDAVWRAGLAIMPNGQLAFAVGQMSMWQFAEKLIEAGAVFAGYTDGGSSTSLLTQGGRIGYPTQHPVPSWLVARGAFIPPIILVGLAAAAGGYYAWRKYGRG